MTHSVKRTAELKQLLTEHRERLQSEVRDRIREGRVHSAKEVVDVGEDSDNVHEAVIGFSLLQMRSDMLSRVDQALTRLDAGHYGDCADCGQAITELRLRVLPFAVRCRACETVREQARFTVKKASTELPSVEMIRPGRRSAQG